MSDGPRILDAQGCPMAPAPARPQMLAGGRNSPYDAADYYGDHMANWQPWLGSPDGELNLYRDTIVARVRDLVRNDGWASGIVTRILDNAVGANLRPISKPDYAALAAWSGVKAFDAEWAYEFTNALDARYRIWATDEGKWSDMARRQTMPQMLRLGFRHKLIDGDALAMLHWRPDRVGYGRAQYATAVQIIDPDRLSNPQLRFDTQMLRGGVEVDEDDAAIAYYIRRAHQGDWFNAVKSLHWDRIPRETDWGRPIIVHDFDMDRAGQHRGGVGVLGPVVTRLKMLFRYDGAELDASILNAVFSAYIESPFDEAFVEGMLSDGDKLNAYQEGRAVFHQDSRITIPGSGAQMRKLYPGEKIGQVQAARPNSNFRDFEKAVLRNVASAAGVSAQQASNDWSDVNYSSARGALLEFWKTLSRRRDDFTMNFCRPIRSAFVEEAMARRELPLPAGAPDFAECRTAYARAKWIGPGRGWIDPVAEVKGAVLGMDAALMDYDELCAEQGLDGDDMIASRKNVIRRFEEAGLTPPAWANIMPAGEPLRDPAADPQPSAKEPA